MSRRHKHNRMQPLMKSPDQKATSTMKSWKCSRSLRMALRTEGTWSNRHTRNTCTYNAMPKETTVQAMRQNVRKRTMIQQTEKTEVTVFPASNVNIVGNVNCTRSNQMLAAFSKHRINRVPNTKIRARLLFAAALRVRRCCLSYARCCLLYALR